jgi:hypothetical protein
MTIITAREARLIAELANATKDWNCTRREALLEILYTFYEAAGFESERLATEFEPMSDNELLEAYLNI